MWEHVQGGVGSIREGTTEHSDETGEGGGAL